MQPDDLIQEWLDLPDIQFSRRAVVDGSCIQCDCSGLINLLAEHIEFPKPYGLKVPRAVHYFSILQEIGSNHISQAKAGNLMGWRKDNLPKSGDTGHVMLLASEPAPLGDNLYRVAVYDATKRHNGLARREVELQTDSEGRLLGVRLHLSESKVKRTPIYHVPLMNKRYCLGCGLPRKLCLCGEVEVSDRAADVVILRHPDERKKTLSTVSLIKQRYPSLLVKEGKVFNPLRNADLALLFPEVEVEPEGGSLKIHAPSDLEGDIDARLKGKTLVILDATWRKAKRMLHENEWLRHLPRVTVESQGLSDYLLRKVPDERSLATVEAFALAQNDPGLQGLFRTLMQKQITLMGRDTYEANYRDFINYEAE